LRADSFPKTDHVVIYIYPDGIAGHNLLRQRVLVLWLDGALVRVRTMRRFEPGFGQLVERRRRERKPRVARRQSFAQITYLVLGDAM